MTDSLHREIFHQKTIITINKVKSLDTISMYKNPLLTMKFQRKRKKTIPFAIAKVKRIKIPKKKLHKRSEGPIH